MAIGLIASLMFRLVFMGGIGLGLRRRGLINDDFQSRLSSILLNIIMPLNILVSSNIDYDRSMVSEFLIVGLASFVFFIVCILLMTGLSRLLPIPRDNQKLFVNLAVYPGYGTVGFAIVQELYGDVGMLYFAVFNMISTPIYYAHGVMNINKKGFSIWKILMNPMLISSILALIIYISPFRLPAFIATTCRQIGAMATPISMIVAGATLAQMKFSSLWTNFDTYLITFMRQIALPALLALSLYALGITGVWPAACVVATGTFTGAITLILSEQYGHDVQYCARAIAQGTIFMPLTLPLVIIMADKLFL